MTFDEARRIAVNVAKLLELLGAQRSLYLLGHRIEKSPLWRTRSEFSFFD
jgi:hypothetical protein